MTRYPDALAGTRAAYQPCSRCRHARIRHEDSGEGRCMTLTRTRREDPKGTGPAVVYVRCDCQGGSYEL